MITSLLDADEREFESDMEASYREQLFAQKHPRLYRVVRSGARYERTLRLLRFAKEIDPKTVTKSGVMVGLGEEMHELLQVYRDLASVGVNVLTIGQYLRPSKDHLPIARYYTPDEFAFMKR